MSPMKIINLPNPDPAAIIGLPGWRCVDRTVTWAKIPGRASRATTRWSGRWIFKAATQTMSDRVYIFDTTLRDGEQSPGCSMTVAEKTLMAHKLVELGVDILEAGFPIASDG